MVIEFGADTISLALISVSRHDETNESSRYGHGEKIEAGNFENFDMFAFLFFLFFFSGRVVIYPTRAHFCDLGLICDPTNHTF